MAAIVSGKSSRTVPAAQACLKPRVGPGCPARRVEGSRERLAGLAAGWKRRYRRHTGAGFVVSLAEHKTTRHDDRRLSLSSAASAYTKSVWRRPIRTRSPVPSTPSSPSPWIGARTPGIAHVIEGGSSPRLLCVSLLAAHSLHKPGAREAHTTFNALLPAIARSHTNAGGGKRKLRF